VPNGVYILFPSLPLLFLPDFPLLKQGQEITFPTDGVRWYTDLYSRVFFYWLHFIGRTSYYLLAFISAPQQLQCPAWRLCSLPESHREERSSGNGCSLPVAEDNQPIWV